PEIDLFGFSRIDGSVWFYSRVDALFDHDSVVLDIGCGRGATAEHPVRYQRHLRTLRGRCSKAIGIDISLEGEQNRLVDEFRLISDPRHWPVEDELVDVAIADWVLEHGEDPAGFLAECARVIKPGGYLCLRTSNAHGYPAMVARAVPQRWHAWLLHKAQPQRQTIDVFPAFYRCNTRRILGR